MVNSFFYRGGEEVNLCQQLQTVFILSVLAILFMYCAYTLYRVFKIIGFFRILMITKNYIFLDTF